MRKIKSSSNNRAIHYVNDTFPTLAYNDTNVINPMLKQYFSQNKAFIPRRSNSLINRNVGNAGGSGIWNNFDYSSAKCKRDVGYIVDAWINDPARGGNLETRISAASYQQEIKML